MKPYLLILLLSLPFFQVTQAQSNDQNMAIPKDSNIPIAGSERTDLIFNRSFFVGEADTAVNFNNGRSGTYSLGIGYGIPIGRVVEIKFEPRITWQKLIFTESGDSTKFFPTAVTGDNYVYEKMRMAYIEVPVALKLKMARNAEDKYKFLIEAGFSFGFNTGSTAKARVDYDSDGDGSLDAEQTVKVNNIPDVASLRYGPYGRIGTNWISIYGFYRLTDVFDADERFELGNGSQIPYPNFPKLELGLNIRI